MPDEMDHDVREFYVCTSCWQVFASYPAWEAHANGPFADIDEALDARVTLEPGDAIPAGMRVGEGVCWFPDEELDPAEWTDIEQGDLVYDDEAGRFIGTVGHRDDNLVDIEPPDGRTMSVQRDDFHPKGRYRAIRL